MEVKKEERRVSKFNIGGVIGNLGKWICLYKYGRFNRCFYCYFFLNYYGNGN